MEDRLAVILIGNRNSGKSITWNQLFGAAVRTGKYNRQLHFTDGTSVDVFLVSGSPEEREEYVGKILGGANSKIVLCSVQYTLHGLETINYFSEKQYFLYVQWLRPGFSDDGSEADDLGLMEKILACPSLIGRRSGKVNPEERVTEIREYLHMWAHNRKLAYGNPT